MFKPEISEFKRLSEKGTKSVPVFRKFQADMETPVSALSAFTDFPRFPVEPSAA